MKGLLKGLLVELRQGNTTAILIVAAAMYALWVIVGKPIYDRLDVRTESTYNKTIKMQKTIEELRMKMERIEAENLKTRSKEQVSDSEAGIYLEVEY